MTRSDTVIGLDRILQLVDAVPPMERFPTVDELCASFAELAAAAPETVRLRRIGSSRLGEPIQALTVGTGSRHAVIVGGVHPNEPIGGPTALHLARILATDAGLRTELDYTWHIIGCVDPDGMRLNEGWFGGGLDRAAYGRQFYRPAPDEQVEWTFPVSYKELYFDRVIPETLALMRLLDDTRPTFLCTLHNGELGGVYYYLSAPAPELYPVLHAVPQHLGVPLDSGEPEVPYVELLAAAIYGDPRIDDQYEYAVSLGLDPTAGPDNGTSSAGYARRYNTFTMISELPYWTHPQAADTTPSDTNYREVLRLRADGMRELATTISSVLAEAGPDLSLQSPFRRALSQFAPGLAESAEQEARRARLSDTDRLATVAELYTGSDLIHCFRMRYAGMTLRLLEAEINAGNGTPRIRAQYRRILSEYDRWATEAARVTPAQTLPIRTLVGVQLGAILAAAAHAHDRFGPSGVPATSSDTALPVGS